MPELGRRGDTPDHSKEPKTRRHERTPANLDDDGFTQLMRGNVKRSEGDVPSLQPDRMGAGDDNEQDSIKRRTAQLEQQLADEGLPAEPVDQVARAWGDPLSLNDESLVDCPDPKGTPDDVLNRNTLEEELHRAINALPERQATAVTMRYGLDRGEGEALLREIGDAIGASANTARQVTQDGLNALRAKEYRFKELVVEPGQKEEPRPAPPAPTKVDAPFSGSPVNVPIDDPNDQRPYATRIDEAANNAAEAWLRAREEEFAGGYFGERPEEGYPVPEAAQQWMESVGILFGQWPTVEKSSFYDPAVGARIGFIEGVMPDYDELRDDVLRRQIANLGAGVTSLSATRQRIESRPLQSPEARAASLAVLDARIQAMNRLRTTLDQYAPHA